MQDTTVRMAIEKSFSWQDKALTWLPNIKYAYVTNSDKELHRIGKLGLGFKNLGRFNHDGRIRSF